MQSYILLLIAIFTFGFTEIACATEINDLIHRIETRLNGKSAYLKISMHISTKRTQRSMEMESYSIGNDKSFIKITYPRKDYGITFLKRDNAMWQYVPRIEKVIKIPASMMLQSWMGSDFSNDDLVKESSLSRDYTSVLLNETESLYTIELTPLEDSAVVWGRMVMDIDKEVLLPSSVQYYDEDGILVRTLIYTEVKMLDDRLYPTKWVMTPHGEEKKGHQTILFFKDGSFNKEIRNIYFTKKALKRFSK